MKNRIVIGVSVMLCSLITALTGCSMKKEQHSNTNDFSESESSTEISVPYDNSDNIEGSDNSDANSAGDDLSSLNESTPKEGAIKSYKHTIETAGMITNDIEIDNLYLTAMDNNNFYFSSTDLPQKISSVDRGNHELKREVMTYDLDVEDGFVTSKRTYCGNYVVFPCLGSPDDEYVTLRAFVGKSGEKARCILEQPTGAISVCAAELNENEMVFLCTGKEKGIFNIYKYNFNEEKARLIYTKELDISSQNSNPLIACFNGDVYFIFRTSQNKNTYCIKKLDADGGECDEMFLELPAYSDTSMCEFTVAENNILIRFEPSDSNGYFRTVLIDKKTKKIFSDSGDNKLGVRFNDGLIDGRYILFRAGTKSYSTHPMVCVFDDFNSEFHFITFAKIDNPKIINTVADFSGDVVFWVNEYGTNSIILFEDVCSLIANN